MIVSHDAIHFILSYFLNCIKDRKVKEEKKCDKLYNENSVERNICSSMLKEILSSIFLFLFVENEHIIYTTMLFASQSVMECQYERQHCEQTHATSNIGIDVHINKNRSLWYISIYVYMANAAQLKKTIQTPQSYADDVRALIS